MSEANRGALLYVAETVWGETPSGPPTLTLIRRTGGTFSQAPSHTTSAEIRSDRQVADLIRTSIAPTASIDFEASYGAHDDLFEGVMMSTWSSPASTESSTDFDVVATAGTVGCTGAFTSMVAGQWFEVAGSANNDGYHQIATRTDADNVIVADPSALTDVSSEDAVTISSDGMIRPGITLKSFTFEEQYQDVANAFMVYRGMVLGSLNLNIATEAIINGTFGDMAGGVPIGSAVAAAERVAATVGDGTPTAAQTNSITNAVDNVYSVREGDAETSMLISGLSLTINNSLRGLPVVGHLGPAAVNLGTLQVTGQMSAYFGTNSLAIVDKLLADTASKNSFRVEDGAGNAYIFTVAALKYTGGTPEMGTLDTDVPVNLAFTGYTDGTTAFQIDRFDAA